ncbi:hypothetical protein N0U24_01865 [Peribacillus frigoritolerans]|uniref:hypothetical protein n=1 Tax=Peribacillus frigoritolerans TaxID=450367 RepID=UPI0021AA80B6|nr:hypothetical protein [Peribacillus frigoritolerans]MCT4475905.1 hypothetical protein [Peribacillus frigoritolerans]
MANMCSPLFIKFFYNLGLDTVINFQYTNALITGLRIDKIGLLLGIEENNRIKPAGIMEFVTPADRKQFYS